MTLSRINHTGGAVSTTLTAPITAVSTSCSIAASTGWPSTNFVMKIDAGTAAEEKILCSALSGTTVNFTTRGYDGTSATSHSASAPAEHDLAAVVIDDANDHVYTTSRDDHTQYSRTDGTRAFSGAVTITTGGLDIDAGGLTVAAGGANVTGGLTVAAGGANVTGGLTADTLTVGGTAFDAVPTGVIHDFAAAAASIPSGWLQCDGSAVSRTTYSGLFGVIGVTWGAGDGLTTFNVPDLRGRVTAGVGSVGTNSQPTLVLAGTGGEQNHTLTTAELASHAHSVSSPNHSHSITDPTHAHTVGGTTLVGYGNASSTVGYINTGGTKGAFTAMDAAGTGISATDNATAGITTTASNGSGSAHNNMQPYAAVIKIIKT